MDIIGIICEYNPFHNGHLYHLNKIKEMYPNSLIILVMSGNITERGDLSIINKWDKTLIALHYGIDLVVELPFTFSSQSADIFCYGGMSILNHLKVDKVIFGSECNNINDLTKIAKTQLNNKEYNIAIKNYLKEGYNYPTALSKALKDITLIDVKEPNDILAIGYIREIITNNYNIEPICIKRTNNYNDLSLNNYISSATSIRHALYNNEDISNQVPEYTLKYLHNLRYIEDYYPYLKYKIISEINNLDKYQTVDKNIIPRIKKYILQSNSLEELILNTKSKNYTYNKLKRMFTHILMSFTKEEASKNTKIEYIRILGFNKKGQQYLNKIKKNINIPLITKYNDKYLNIENRISNIINLNQNDKLEYQYSTIIFDQDKKEDSDK